MNVLRKLYDILNSRIGVGADLCQTVFHCSSRCFFHRECSGELPCETRLEIASPSDDQTILLCQHLGNFNNTIVARRNLSRFSIFLLYYGQPIKILICCIRRIECSCPMTSRVRGDSGPHLDSNSSSLTDNIKGPMGPIAPL